MLDRINVMLIIKSKPNFNDKKKMNLTLVSKIKKIIVEWLISKDAISLMTNKIIIMLVIKSEPKLVTKKINPNLSLVSKRKNNLVE